VKLYGEDVTARRGSPERRYSPAQVIGTRYQRIQGAPNAHYTSTSFAERHNLTMRMSHAAHDEIDECILEEIR
jgi:hypothetical protein